MTSTPSIQEKSLPRPALFAVVALALAGGLALACWQGWKWFQFDKLRREASLDVEKYDFASARKNLETCLTLRPHDTDTLLLAAQASRRDGQLLQAQEFLDHYADEVGRSTPEGALQRVLLLVQRGQVKENVQALMDLVDVRHPQSEQILEALAVGSNHVYRMDEATFWIKQLQDRYPANPIGRLLDAQTRETLRQRDRALEILSRLVQDYPENEKARRYYAGLLFKGHKYEEAVEQYRALLSRDPNDLLSLLGLVHSMLVLNRMEEAEPYLRELETRHPENPDALLERARFALKTRKPDEAERLLTRAIAINPNDHELQLEMATVLTQLNRPDEAKKHLDRFRQIEEDLKRLDLMFQEMVKKPADPGPRLEAGLICLRNGQTNEGLRWLAGALELRPDHGPTHLALAKYYESMGNKSQAEFHRKRAR